MREVIVGHEHITFMLLGLPEIENAVFNANNGQLDNCTTCCWTTLNTLGIYECETCDGEPPSNEWGEGAIICSRCNGRGWITK